MRDTHLPPSWAMTEISSVSQFLGGGTPPKNDSRYWDHGAIPWVSPKDMKSFNIQTSEDRVTEDALSLLSLVPSNSVLVVVRSGILAHSLPIAVNSLPVTINQDIRAIVPEPDISARYLAWQLVAQAQKILATCSKQGTTVPSIESPALARFHIAIAPKTEQFLIVEKLEALISNLDTGISELKLALQKLNLLEQSLLNSAVTGDLSAEWRSSQARRKAPMEDGAQALQEILAKRRSHWETKQIEKFKKSNRALPANWRDTYPEPALPDLANLPNLPNGWTWASLDMLGEITSGIAKGTKRTADARLREVPYLRVANVQRGYLDLRDIKVIPATESEIDELALQNGDILLNEGGDRDKLGRGWVWQNELPECIHQNHVFRVRPYSTKTISEFISHHSNTFGQAWFQSIGKQTTNLASINLSALRSFPVPIPPPEEQQEIIKQLDLGQSSLKAQRLSLTHGISQSELQHDNILRAAFSGKLTTQNPEDEPASILLSRIATARLAHPKPRKQPKRPRLNTVNRGSMIRTVENVLSEAGDWLPASEVFKRCGVSDGAETDQIQAIYAELRALDMNQKLLREPVTDQHGRKTHDKLKLAP
ncbi:type I restriction endonuclease subunit S [Corallococcus exiguus]|nr:type I restriction endonuclease subunit S [Corallococcus exiguus]